MSIKDVIKNGFLSKFMDNISVLNVSVTLILAFVFAIVVYYVYQLTCDKTIYSKKFNVTMSLMTIVTAAVVLSMQANVVVSLGMVGALSIVRFRTAIKEPKDLLFLFWSISNGIILGAGIYAIAFILVVVMGISLLIFEILPTKTRNMLLVVNLKDIDKEDEVENELIKIKAKYNVKSRNVFKDKVDIIYEISTKDEKELVKVLSKNKNVLSMNLIKQD